MKFKYLILFFIIVLSCASCINKKKIVYFQNSESVTNNYKAINYDNRIQPDDLLDIHISSANPEAAAPFNQEMKILSTQYASSNTETKHYLVDKEGFIEFPILGRLKVSGLDRTELIAMIKEKLSTYISDPVVYLSTVNFKVSVLGEVAKPGVVVVTGDRISLPEVLAMSGDLSIFGQRQNILIVRDEMGVKSFNRVDITQAEFVNSPYYYLKQNDVIYVEPRKVKVDSTAFGTNITTTISILGFLLTTTLLLLKL